MSAAALSVRVGQFHDPIDRQGLARFLEHMLFREQRNIHRRRVPKIYYGKMEDVPTPRTGQEKNNILFSVKQRGFEEHWIGLASSL